MGTLRYTVPEDWKSRLRAYLQARYDEDRDRLSTSDFPTHGSVIIRFPDGSQVLFRYAFAIPDETGREVAVFTEHCGYHVFPLDDAELEVVHSVPAVPVLGDRGDSGKKHTNQ